MIVQKGMIGRALQDRRVVWLCKREFWVDLAGLRSRSAGLCDCAKGNWEDLAGAPVLCGCAKRNGLGGPCRSAVLCGCAKWE